jgi:hypothetical protein
MERQREHPSARVANQAPKKTYTHPQIIYQGKLEVRAGSPLGGTPGMEFFDLANPMSGVGKK